MDKQTAKERKKKLLQEALPIIKLLMEKVKALSVDKEGNTPEELRKQKEHNAVVDSILEDLKEARQMIESANEK